jgi:uncharacterized OB-fold protein
MMALTKCAECGQPVSTRARACPHCGAPPPGEGRRLAIGAAVVALSIGVVLALTTSTVRRASGDDFIVPVLAVSIAMLAVLSAILKRR